MNEKKQNNTTMCSDWQGIILMSHLWLFGIRCCAELVDSGVQLIKYRNVTLPVSDEYVAPTEMNNGSVSVKESYNSITGPISNSKHSLFDPWVLFVVLVVVIGFLALKRLICLSCKSSLFPTKRWFFFLGGEADDDDDMCLGQDCTLVVLSISVPHLISIDTIFSRIPRLFSQETLPHLDVSSCLSMSLRTSVLVFRLNCSSLSVL